MGLFKSKYEKELDLCMGRIDMNMSNNYKDAAQKDLQHFEQTLDAFLAEGRLKPKEQAYYEARRKDYRERMQGYTHKDQKPYWT